MPDATLDHLLELIALPGAKIPEPVLQTAQMSLFDWAVCGLAGADEPVAQKVRSYLAAEASAPRASVMAGTRLSPRAAAMVNATTAHALDYDDTHFAHVGHLAVGIYGTALAVAEDLSLPLSRTIEAFAIGSECAIAIGQILGRDHYDRGFHQTATAGAFGATAAASRLYGLSRAEQIHAFGLCATRASGLKNQFGTMGKPWNAGIAAANGVECAGLAKLGMTSAEGGLSGDFGFIATHSAAAEPLGTDRPRFLLPEIQYKFHACCHGTHAMLQALSGLPVPDTDQIDRIVVGTHPRWMNVCNIEAPRTGLEVKFSYVWLAAMALTGRSTSRPGDYTDALAQDAKLRELAGRVEVRGDPSLTDMQATIALTNRNGGVRKANYDLADPVPIEECRERLREKGRALLGERADRLWDGIAENADKPATAFGALLLAD